MDCANLTLEETTTTIKTDIPLIITSTVEAAQSLPDTSTHEAPTQEAPTQEAPTTIITTDTPLIITSTVEEATTQEASTQEAQLLPETSTVEITLPETEVLTLTEQVIKHNLTTENINLISANLITDICVLLTDYSDIDYMRDEQINKRVCELMNKKYNNQFKLIILEFREFLESNTDILEYIKLNNNKLHYNINHYDSMDKLLYSFIEDNLMNINEMAQGWMNWDYYNETFYINDNVNTHLKKYLCNTIIKYVFQHYENNVFEYSEIIKQPLEQAKTPDLNIGVDALVDTDKHIVDVETIHLTTPDSENDKTNINDIFTMLTVNKGVPQNVKCKKTKIIGFTYDIRARGAGLPASAAKANASEAGDIKKINYDL